jgi:hypothetical protein
VKKKSDLKWRVEPDLIEAWMILPIAENNVKISSTCSQKNQDKTWSCRMNSQDQKEF